MDALNDMQIMELSKALTSNDAAQEILVNFLPLVSGQFVQSQNVLLQKMIGRGEDTLTKSLLPADFKDWIPIKTTGNGNCLFNAASIALSLTFRKTNPYLAFFVFWRFWSYLRILSFTQITHKLLKSKKGLFTVHQ